jgi:Tol biopolymer transport system component
MSDIKRIRRQKPAARTLERFDLAVLVAVLALLAAIVAVVARGDQVGVGVESFGPRNTASSRAKIQVTFDEPVADTSVASNFVLQPSVRGKFLVSQNQVTFTPTQPLAQGQDYTVTLKAGVQASTGRSLKHDVQWTFRVVPPLIVYLGPADSIVQNLFLVDPTAQSPQKLTASKEGVESFDVAPDGSSIVYGELQGQGTASLFVWDAATGTTRLLYECKDAACSDPVWRPDGGAIAFERVDLNTGTGMAPGAPRVWILDLATNSARPLFADSQQLGYLPRWSPDSTRIAVYNVNAGGVVVHDFASNKDKTIQTVQGEVGSFSPDGRWLYFPKVVALKDQNYVTHLVLVDVSSDLYAQHDLIPDDDASSDVEAEWLPDSSGLIVARRPAGSTGADSPQLYTVEIATRRSRPLSIAPDYSQSNLTISPAGDVLLLQRFPLGKPGARPQVWTLKLATGELKLVAENGFVPRWLP